jgi:parallel beta-helix repeat protein
VNSIFEENVIRGSASSSIMSVGPAVVEDNFLTGNTGGSGIAISTGAVVMCNRLVSSTGISVGGDSIVQENDLSGCSSGIVVGGSNSTVEENSISSGVNGISVNAPATRVMVEGNNVFGCTGTAIYVVSSSSSLVVRNSVSSPPGGLPYDLGTGNPHGSIVDVSAVDDIGSLGVALDTWINFLF